MTQTRKTALEALLAKMKAGEGGWGLERPKELHTDLVWKAWMGSFDAAFALHLAVLPGWEYGYDGGMAWVKLPGLRSSYRHNDKEGITARAWLIAIITALIAEEPE